MALMSATSHFEADHLSGTQKAELHCTACKNKAALMHCFHSALRGSAEWVLLPDPLDSLFPEPSNACLQSENLFI